LRVDGCGHVCLLLLACHRWRTKRGRSWSAGIRSPSNDAPSGHEFDPSFGKYICRVPKWVYSGRLFVVSARTNKRSSSSSSICFLVRLTVFSDLVSLNKTSDSSELFIFSKQCVQSPRSRRASACLVPMRSTPSGCHFCWLEPLVMLRALTAPSPPLPVHDHDYWDNLGLDEEYHVFSAIFESNGVSPHQVLLDAKIDYLMNDDVPLFSGCRQVPRGRIHRRHLSVMVPISVSFSLSCLLGAYTDISFGGVSIWWAVFVSVFSVFLFLLWRSRSTSFRCQMVPPLI